MNKNTLACGLLLTATFMIPGIVTGHSIRYR